MSRYIDRRVFFNNEEIYAKKAKERGIKGFFHYNSPVMNKLTSEDLSALVIQGHVWAEGDRYYKLAQEHYGDAKHWWLIAWFNNKPTEAHVSLGDIVEVPLPLEQILGIYYR
jgi:hypothetical protein